MGTRMPGGARQREPALTCVAAIVGFAHRLPAKGAGILLRSSIHTIVLEEAGRALAVLREELACDAIVLNLMDVEVSRRALDFVELLRVPSPSGRAIAGVVIHERTLPAQIAAAFAGVGAVLLPRSRFSYRRVAWLLRTALGLKTENHPRVQRLHVEDAKAPPGDRSRARR